MPVEPRRIFTGPFRVRRHSDGVLIIDHQHELGRDRLVLSAEDADLLITALTDLRTSTP